MLSNLRRIGKQIAGVFLAGLLIFYYYLILSIVSGQKSGESNKAMSSFIIIFFSDLFVTAFITAVSIRFLAVYVLQNKGKIKYAK